MRRLLLAVALLFAVACSRSGPVSEEKYPEPRYPQYLAVYPPPAHATWTESVIAASANHTGYFPTMTVHIGRRGQVERVEGGGRKGHLLRMLLENPKMKNARFPTLDHTGYWHLTQDGFATNPKFVRDVARLTRGSSSFGNLSERNRAGVQHLSFSYDRSSQDPRDLAYAAAEELPVVGPGRMGHTAHMHVYFPTVRWKLRDTGEWITISDKGSVRAFDDPEVRALAAKYGDTKDIFRYEWIPGIPGVNVPGDHARDYGADPWKWIMSEWEQIQAGTYSHYLGDYKLDRPVPMAPGAASGEGER